MENSEERSDAAPLTEPTYFILLSLLPGPSHGYAIMKDVFQLSQSRVSLSTGTLYGALKRLLEMGWIRRVDESASNENGRDRKAYCLTDAGKMALQAEVERLGVLVSAARKAETHPEHSLGKSK